MVPNVFPNNSLWISMIFINRSMCVNTFYDLRWLFNYVFPYMFCCFSVNFNYVHTLSIVSHWFSIIANVFCLLYFQWCPFRFQCIFTMFKGSSYIPSILLFDRFVLLFYIFNNPYWSSIVFVGFLWYPMIFYLFLTICNYFQYFSIYQIFQMIFIIFNDFVPQTFLLLFHVLQ